MPAAALQLFAWPRLRFVLPASLIFGLLFSIGATTPPSVWVLRATIVGLLVLLAFGVLEHWPPRLPAWLGRWALQLLGVVIAVPIGAYAGYWFTTGELQWWRDTARIGGYFKVFFTGVLFAPWMALGAMVRQRDAQARHQALNFQLERSELERQALDARMRLLQAQVQPHFLFNTLANVRALVRAGAPQATAVLDSLIAYLRFALPRMDEPGTTLAQELELVRAYLDVMHMRLPDRLQFTLHADAGTLGLQCPPTSLLTLVENAVRHGIDPSEEGGRIDVSVSLRADRCIARVIDTGVGLQPAQEGLGTGLATLRTRLQLVFGGDVRVSLSGLFPHGACAEIEFPALPVRP